MIHIRTQHDGTDLPMDVHHHDTVVEARSCQAEFSQEEYDCLAEAAWLLQEQRAWSMAYEYQEQDPRDLYDLPDLLGAA